MKKILRSLRAGGLPGDHAAILVLLLLVLVVNLITLVLVVVT